MLVKYIGGRLSLKNRSIGSLDHFEQLRNLKAPVRKIFHMLNMEYFSKIAGNFRVTQFAWTFALKIWNRYLPNPNLLQI